MQDDVERVARKLCEIGIGSKRCPCADSGVFRCVNELPGIMARAAMVATLELTAEALRGIVSGQDETEGAAQTNIADWLQQRANEVKEPSNG